MSSKNKQTSPLLLALALSLALVISGCGGQADAGREAPEASETAAEGARVAGPEAAREQAAAPARESESAEGEHGEEGEERDSERGAAGEGEHAEGPAEGEEEGTYVSVAEAWDATRDGTRLTLVYDPGYDTFQGRVYNAGGARLCDVRVEVHLGDGTELGPSDPTDLDPGASALVELSAAGRSFDRWTAHAETSACSG